MSRVHNRVDYEKSPFSLRENETRAHVKISPREERRDAAVERGVSFTRGRVSLALVSLRKNGDYS